MIPIPPIDTTAPAPIHLGPTWEKDAFDQWLLPKFTLGWQALKWIEDNLLAEESTTQNPIPFKPTSEQTRFILWWYAIDERGRFVYRDGILQRLKGWGRRARTHSWPSSRRSSSSARAGSPAG